MRSAVTLKPQRIPVVLATDIGDDIDDTWALGLLLQVSRVGIEAGRDGLWKTQYRGRRSQISADHRPWPYTHRTGPGTDEHGEVRGRMSAGCWVQDL